RIRARSCEWRSSEREDATVTGDHPVAVVLRSCGHRNDGLVQADAAGRAEESGVAEAEDATVSRVEPIALPRLRRCHAEDGRVQAHPSCRPEESGVAEAEDAAVAPPNDKTSPTAVAMR